MRRVSSTTALACLALLLPVASAGAASSGQALVIGEATYTSLPSLPGCALSAHAVAAALRGLGFTVDEQNDASSGAVYAAIGSLARQLAASPQAPVFVYVCGYATGLEDRPFLLPVSANVSRPTDVLTQGVLAKTLLDAVIGGKPATAVVALDAVPTPNNAAPLPLDALTHPALPPAVGYIAVQENAPGNTPTPLAAALVPALRGPTVEAAKLLATVQQQLAGLKTASVAALHSPESGPYLAGAPPAPAAVSIAPPPSAAAQPVAAPPPSAAAQPVAAPPPAALPDEDQMTDAQRRLMQRALAHLGYYDAQTDGIFGPDTRAAIRRWQHEVHAPMTGHLTAGEASKLAASWD